MAEPDKRKDETQPQEEIREKAAGTAAGGEESGLSYEEWARRISGVAEGDEAYQMAMARLTETEVARPAYAGTYDDDIREAYDRILDRESFRYSLDDDALYQQYADRFMAAGKLAMRDTMGQASALTGGYGSSYGQAVGQQTYDAWLQGLGDVALEMYDRAYGRYKDEGKALTEAYERARDMGGEEYGRYQDALGQWNKDRSYAADATGEARDRAYRTDSEAWDRYRQERQFEYDKQADYAATLAKYGDFSGYAELFGEDRAAQMRKVWIAGNFDLAYNSGMITADEYRAMTGKWPPGYSTGGGGGGSGSKKKDSGNRYDAVLTEVRIMDASGSSTGTIQNKLDSAYGAGALTKPQYTWLTSNFGSGSTGSSSSVKRPGGTKLA